MTTVHRLVVVGALLVCLGVPTPAAAAKWTRLQSANFLFIGDADEREVRRVAQKLEQFREALMRTFGQGAGLAPVPTVVFVFATDRSFTPYKPRYRGKPMEVAGYFQSGEHVNYISLVPGRESDDYGVIFHEYTHFVVTNIVGYVPPWIGEGLAEFYETFEERDNGRSVLIGRPSGSNLQTLRGQPMPLTELMSVDHSSPVYNEGDRRGIFYAESWALVHYLLGNQARAGQMTAYLGAIRSGAAPAEAFTTAFKTDTKGLEEELTRYLGRFTFPAMEYKFPERTGNGGVSPGATLDELEANAYLAELLAHSGRVDDARALLRGVGDTTTSARALGALGAVELRAGNTDAALALLERAAGHAPADAWIQSAYGRALGARLRAARGDPSAHEALLPKAKAVLTTAASLTPVSTSTLVELALVELESGQDLAHAKTLIESAIRQAPAREGYRLLYGQVLMNQGEFDAALAMFGPLVATGSQPGVKEEARSLMGVLVQRRQQAADVAARRAAAAATASASGPRPPGPEVGSVAPPVRPPGAANRMLALRPVHPGEERVRAEFDSVECSASGFVLQFRAGASVLRFSTPQLDQVDFVSFRNDTGPAVKCGEFPTRVPALVTFKPAASGGQVGMGGQVIAVELVPDDFVL